MVSAWTTAGVSLLETPLHAHGSIWSIIDIYMYMYIPLCNSIETPVVVQLANHLLLINVHVSVGKLNNYKSNLINSIVKLLCDSISMYQYMYSKAKLV